ncbi:MAG TPA: patatin-like phospholipase family protein [Chthoniobacterales bacterium]|nr:patatin-like phospholipase family protein [Chthoniobacterales bacterium]
MNIVKLIKKKISWEDIANKALENQNLISDIRVNAYSVSVMREGWWEWIKAFCGYGTKQVDPGKVETLKNLKDHLAAYFSKVLHRFLAELEIHEESGVEEDLRIAAKESLAQIIQQLEKNIKDTTLPTSQAIQIAHSHTIKSLIHLRHQFLPRNPTPHFFKIKAKEGIRGEKWGVMKPAPYAENMVLSGGGVKGVGYVGAYRAMEGAGTLSHLRRVAGSSAGAVPATLVASGMDAEALQNASERFSYLKILVGQSKDSLIGQGETFGKEGYFKGTYLIDELNQEIIGSIRCFFEQFSEEQLSEKINTLKKDQQLTEAEEREILNLREALKKKENHGLKEIPSLLEEEKLSLLITFHHLALLRKIDSSKFKELTVTGFDITKNKEQYFNAEKTPEMHIARAVRISISIPWVYRSITTDQGDAYEDGAVGSRIPTEIYPNLSKTLVLGFDDNGHFYKVVHHERIEETPSMKDRLINSLEECISENKNILKDIIRDERKLRRAGANAYDVYHGDLQMMSFLASPKHIHAAELQAEARMWEQLAARQNHVTYDVFDALEQAMEQMTPLELEHIVLEYNKPPKANDKLIELDRKGIVLAAQRELAQRSIY